eukprot:TRINITY_DN4937_c0_g1_i1.p1 TRINITY_DN4937_c0_g1~~TRINITY_DN4937_c0_g1_i1.p1  ORF type:complete len:296 (-),score=49.41 TRINITY_DN4937_c0_g1_i1:214-1101(-)
MLRSGPSALEEPQGVDGRLSWPSKDYCELCSVIFTIFVRRHHCRVCLRSICYNCSAFSTHNGQSVRSCTKCTQPPQPPDLGVEGKDTLHEDDFEIIQKDSEDELPSNPTYREKILRNLLELAIQGSSNLGVKSTTNRYYQYMNKYKTLENALSKLKTKSNGWKKKVKCSVINSIPVLGLPPSLIGPLWHNLRMICLVAALYNHNLHAPETQNKVLSCLAVCTSALPAPPAPETPTGIINEQVVREIAVLGAQVVGWSVAVILTMPANLLIEYLMDNSGLICQRAEEVFGRPCMSN